MSRKGRKPPAPVPVVVVVLLALVVSDLAVAQSASAEESRPGIHTLGLVSSSFRDQRYRRNELEEEMMAAATRAFLASRRFTLIEREKLKAIFNEKDLATILEGGDNDLSKIKGVDYLGLLTYSSEREPSPQGGYQVTYWLEVQLTEVQSGQVMATVSSRSETHLGPATSIPIAGDRLLENLREMYPPQGFIIHISPERVLVDLGEAMGVKKGDKLQVVRKGERIIHPVSGRLMPAEDILVGTLKVVELSQAMATCKVKSADGELQLADRVRLRADMSDKLSQGAISVMKTRARRKLRSLLKI